MARPLGLECENRVVLGHSGITKDISISSSYPAFHFLGYSGKCKDMGGYFRQSVDQLLTKFGAGKGLLVRPFLCPVLGKDQGEGGTSRDATLLHIAGTP
jgi:hypothetical protein